MVAEKVKVPDPAGSGTLTFSATNTYTGDTTISAGTLTVSGTLADTTDVINSGTYDVDATDTIQSLSGSGSVQLADSITLTTGDSGNDTVSGVISGLGSLVKAGSGILTFSGAPEKVNIPEPAFTKEPNPEITPETVSLPESPVVRVIESAN